MPIQYICKQQKTRFVYKTIIFKLYLAFDSLFDLKILRKLQKYPYEPCNRH